MANTINQNQKLILPTPTQFQLSIPIPIEAKTVNDEIPIVNGKLLIRLIKSKSTQFNIRGIYQYHYKFLLFYQYQDPISLNNSNNNNNEYNETSISYQNNNNQWFPDDSGKIQYRLNIKKYKQDILFENTGLISDLINIIDEYCDGFGILDKEFLFYTYYHSTQYLHSFINNSIFQSYIQYYLYHQFNELYEFNQIHPITGEFIRIYPNSSNNNNHNGFQLDLYNRKTSYSNKLEIDHINQLIICEITGIYFSPRMDDDDHSHCDDESDEEYEILKINELLHIIDNEHQNGIWESVNGQLKLSIKLLNPSVSLRGYNQMMIVLFTKENQLMIQCRKNQNIS